MSDRPGELDRSGRLWKLRFVRELAHAPATVWRMVTEPSGLASWFPARVAFDALVEGAPMTFTFGDEDLERAAEAGVEEVPPQSEGVIREVVEGQVFAFEWLGEPIRIELHPLDDGERCRLVFTHAFSPDDAQAPRNATGWHVCLDALVAALDGVTPPDAEARQAELLPAYQRDLAPPAGHA